MECNVVTGELQLNGEICSSQHDEGEFFQNKARTFFNMTKVSSENWIYWGSSSHRITFAEGTAVAVIAGMIAAAVGQIGGAAVIAAMGLSALSVISANSIGGTVSTKVYKFNSSLITQFRYDWSFRASSGDKYGPYTTLTKI